MYKLRTEKEEGVEYISLDEIVERLNGLEDLRQSMLEAFPDFNQYLINQNQIRELHKKLNDLNNEYREEISRTRQNEINILGELFMREITKLKHKNNQLRCIRREELK